MREKIASYLEKAGRSLPAGQILHEVLNILSPNSLAADRVLRSILGTDARFRRERGLWGLVAGRTASGFERTAALHLQLDMREPLFFRGAVHLPASGAAWEFQGAGTEKPWDSRPLERARLEAGNHLLLAWSNRELRQWNRLLRSCMLPEWDGDFLGLGRLAARAAPEMRPPRYPEDLASCLGLAPPDTEQPAAMARFLAESFQCLLDRVPPSARAGLPEVENWIAEGSAKVDFSRFAFGRDFLARIPESPGVYLMRNRAAEVIYVGKSHNLKRRVGSYFTPRALKDPKVARIHGQLYSLECLTCRTDVEALLLEMRMIRDFRPTINLQTEIHERRSRYGHAANLLLLAPSADRVEIYLLKDGLFVGRNSVLRGHMPGKRLQKKIQTLYFRPRPAEAAAGEDWESEIVARFLRTHRRRLNLVDVDEAGSCESVVRRLESYLGDPDQLSRKVYYR